VESGSGVVAGQEMAAASRGEEAELLLGERHQVAVGLFPVGEGVLAQHLFDSFGRRVGVEYEVDFGCRFGIIGKGVVQQMVENATVDRSAVVVVFLKGIQGRLAFVIHVAHAQRQLADFFRLFGHQVGLQIEHDLQPVFDLAEERVVFGEQ